MDDINRFKAYIFNFSMEIDGYSLPMHPIKQQRSDAHDYVNCIIENMPETPVQFQYYTALFFSSHPDASFTKKEAAALLNEHPRTSNNNLSNTLKNSFLINNTDRNWSFFDWAGRSQCPKYCSEIIRLSKEKIRNSNSVSSK